ncbi:uncharacterized protein LOC141895127 [Acropora palmata]|uniref:uncharacterized protein LOC141895127 n=1 Tax=Acropora palmata TaxID=6131 RepID=UPI003DA1B85B
MLSHTFAELFSNIVFNFTRSVAERYDLGESNDVANTIGYYPLEDTGKEWYAQHTGELIYQEYSNSKATSADYLTSSGSLRAQLIDASSTSATTHTPELSPEARDMAWKGLRPSISRTVLNSLSYGFLISVLSATVFGMVSFAVYYFCYQTQLNCELHPKESIPIKLQWLITISEILSVGFLYFWFFIGISFYFRPFQLSGVRKTMVIVSLLFYLLDSIYRLGMQACGISHSKLTVLRRVPAEAIFCLSSCVIIYVMKMHFCFGTLIQQVKFMVLFVVPYALTQFIAILIASCVYPAYNKQDASGKLLIAIFIPLIVVVIKVAGRICIQRLWCRISHPGTSFVLLAPMYCGSAIMLRLLQVDLYSLESVALIGVIHRIAEVFDRSIMAFIDHIIHQVLEKRQISWGGFRTPRRERLAADLTIMSMLSESSAIITVNIFLHLYQYFYTNDNSPLKLLQSFAITTTVPLGIEWFFTSVSIAIETRYKNLPLVAVWRKRWRRHLAVLLINLVMVCIWTSSSLLIAVEVRFKDNFEDHCQMPFNL